MATYGKHLTPKTPRLLKGKKRPRGMAFFLEMIRSSRLRKDLTITDAVIEEAHDLNFDDYREAHSKLEFLCMVPRLGALQHNLDRRIQIAYKECNQLYACPKVCLHQGKKLPLPEGLLTPGQEAPTAPSAQRHLRQARLHPDLALRQTAGVQDRGGLGGGEAVLTQRSCARTRVSSMEYRV